MRGRGAVQTPATLRGPGEARCPGCRASGPVDPAGPNHPGAGPCPLAGGSPGSGAGPRGRPRGSHAAQEPALQAPAAPRPGLFRRRCLDRRPPHLAAPAKSNSAIRPRAKILLDAESRSPASRYCHKSMMRIASHPTRPPVRHLWEIAGSCRSTNVDLERIMAGDSYVDGRYDIERHEEQAS